MKRSHQSNLGLVFNLALVSVCFTSMGLIVSNSKLRNQSINLNTQKAVEFSDHNDPINLQSATLSSLTKDNNCHQFSIIEAGEAMITSAHCFDIGLTDIRTKEVPVNILTGKEFQLPKPKKGKAFLKVIANNQIHDIPVEVDYVDACSIHYRVSNQDSDIRLGDSGAPIVNESGQVIAINYGLDPNAIIQKENQSVPMSKQAYATYKKCD
ncbi:MAG: hypothetical protein ACRCXZ_10145 [Patescibacteria group bacterium]